MANKTRHHFLNWALSGIIFSLLALFFFYLNRNSPILKGNVANRISQLFIVIGVAVDSILDLSVEQNSNGYSRKILIKPVIFFISFSFLFDIGIFLLKMISSLKLFLMLIIFEFLFTLFTIRFFHLEKVKFYKYKNFSKIVVFFILATIILLIIFAPSLEGIDLYIAICIVGIAFFEILNLLLK
ncbi:hypothetical protein Csac_0131 [Caldicellulosiruptor saccharolyticus DSM 8903]|uniref:Uncharacterized protein n=1 Tax=Caldicellulosiruptor saccharolyticus (strain ATCC 43494 / DSM 8903 / Tp8T 6331) TaxID=351627 RepID=A4XFU9_CALS8|nr:MULTISPECIES: hypothetical protein [Caldicellulosiruptor]ABP65784.1 hypothetical protein Csac_0131 [Caldicellulosiruptor saccharolyticus DSM 8903]